MKFYRCATCGKIVAVVKEVDVETICCGEPMQLLEAGTKDEAREKHVPVWAVKDGVVTVKIGKTEHPMTAAHGVEWVALETEQGGCQYRLLGSGAKPEIAFALLPDETVKCVYAYCSQHGLWKCCPGCKTSRGC